MHCAGIFRDLQRRCPLAGVPGRGGRAAAYWPARQPIPLQLNVPRIAYCASTKDFRDKFRWPGGQGRSCLNRVPGRPGERFGECFSSQVPTMRAASSRKMRSMLVKAPGVAIDVQFRQRFCPARKSAQQFRILSCGNRRDNAGRRSRRPRQPFGPKQPPRRRCLSDGDTHVGSWLTGEVAKNQSLGIARVEDIKNRSSCSKGADRQ